METDICIMCEQDFVVGESGNELGFCCECSEKENFPYDLDKYYNDYDEGKVGFKGFDTMSRGILENYIKTKLSDKCYEANCDGDECTHNN